MPPCQRCVRARYRAALTARHPVLSAFYPVSRRRLVAESHRRAAIEAIVQHRLATRGWQFAVVGLQEVCKWCRESPSACQMARVLTARRGWRSVDPASMHLAAHRTTSLSCTRHAGRGRSAMSSRAAWSPGPSPVRRRAPGRGQAESGGHVASPNGGGWVRGFFCGPARVGDGWQRKHSLGSGNGYTGASRRVAPRRAMLGGARGSRQLQPMDARR